MLDNDIKSGVVEKAVKRYTTKYVGKMIRSSLCPENSKHPFLCDNAGSA